MAGPLEILRRPRFLLVILLLGFLFLASPLFTSHKDVFHSSQRYSPLEIFGHQDVGYREVTPVVFHHKPIEINATSIQKIDLNPIVSSKDAAKKQEKVLLLTPLRDAAYHLDTYFSLLTNLTYPHELIDLAFLVSDSTDDTMGILATQLDRIQSSDVKGLPFRSVTIVEKDWGVTTSQDVEDRHAFKYQAPRRKAMARARNYLLATALKPEHAWVYWRDADIVECPGTIVEDLISHDRDVIVPNIWFHRGEIEGRFDYNSWQDTRKSKKLLKSLSPDTVVVEGYPEFDTGRKYMAKMGDWRKDQKEEIKLDGIGGVSIMVKGDVHRSGINFPAYAFENQAETEGFGKMANRAGYEVIGLPNYVVWHIDTEELPKN
ncbi:N-glycosyl-transferase [Saitoella complicata NRRL Y-17804]|uniref:Mannan polymerase II complex ANP1 subunit n=1 Tax=Saitoella complicata (strain BCRC 22490 / CBS 7301 / JCM 7358 / NBRC 10748 / NRRL Y-17804) TaxID=698492 RepID=A0A0E9NFJ4_SAICN|nr:N-glycosyl-transferase [Saitoella complicata NRRL Y-17804]ODQ52920.1 N-glycosyl-transferase [Saitoella complicata NRRL Y-17804]GAO48456.1 hypothetical protein G7K_2629-t1 [Saitoella complicata NRRL Y-17804]